MKFWQSPDVHRAAVELAKNRSTVAFRAMAGPAILEKYRLSEWEKLGAELESADMVRDVRLANARIDVDGDPLMEKIEKLEIRTDILVAKVMVVRDRLPLIIRSLRRK